MTQPAFDQEMLARFRDVYPERPAILTHHLVDHPLLTLEALVELARRMPDADVEYNRGDLPIGIDPADTPSNALSVEETIRRIEHCGSWMVMKFVEQDPAYAALLEATLAELMPVVGPATGAMLRPQAFIFVSSPGAVTPFHFDPEHNILLQIRGTKVMNVFPAADESIVPGVLHEAFHLGGHRNMPWRDEMAAKGLPLAIGPGQAIHVPVKAPHWVQNGPAVSISLSITWRSEWSFAESDARGMNHWLRKFGLSPASPGRWPRRNRAKAIGHRLIRRIHGAYAGLRGTEV